MPTLQFLKRKQSQIFLICKKFIFLFLYTLQHEGTESRKVQKEIARHYQNIRKFWGTEHSKDKQAAAYEGLGKLYVSDERFTTIDGKPQPEYALFLSKAMTYYAKTNLS